MQQKEERFKKLIADNQQRIRNICRYYAPANDDSKDMFQEILINIWKSLDTFRGEASIATWVYRIAINTSLNFAGKHFRQMRLNVEADAGSLKKLFVEDNQEAFLREEKFDLLQNELNQLSVIDKALMGLVLEGLATKEIAEIIGITEPNVRVKIHRIKECLQLKLKGFENEN